MSAALIWAQALVIPLGVGLGVAAVFGSAWLARRRWHDRARRDFESGAFDRAVDEAVAEMMRAAPGASTLYEKWAEEVKAAEAARFGRPS